MEDNYKLELEKRIAEYQAGTDPDMCGLALVCNYVGHDGSIRQAKGGVSVSYEDGIFTIFNEDDYGGGSLLGTAESTECPHGTNGYNAGMVVFPFIPADSASIKPHEWPQIYNLLEGVAAGVNSERRKGKASHDFSPAAISPDPFHEEFPAYVPQAIKDRERDEQYNRDEADEKAMEAADPE